jgi:alpha-tubulin suppressor-like RCC1 family protein
VLLAASAAVVPASPATAPAAPTVTQRLLLGVAVPEGVRPEGTLDAAAALTQRSRIATAQERAADLVVRLGGTVQVRYSHLPYLAVTMPATSVGELRSSALLASVSLDRLRQPTLVRSSTLIGADLLWRQGLTGLGWTVALPDTGIDAAHPFLAGKVIGEACDSSSFAGNATQPATTSLCPGGRSASSAAGSARACDRDLPDCAHGTHVAGIVAGSHGPDGLSGIAPDASLLALQIYSRLADGSGIGAWDGDLVKALERVYSSSGQQRIAAVNLSLAGPELYGSRESCDAEQPALADAVSLLRSVGIATVAAAGNNGSSTSLPSPACLTGVISVGASCTRADAGFCIGGTDTAAGFSNVPPWLDLLAPGTEITSSIPGRGYAALSGTSMAAPHVAGSLALLRQLLPDASVEELLARLGLEFNARAGAGPKLIELQFGAPAARSRSEDAMAPSISQATAVSATVDQHLQTAASAADSSALAAAAPASAAFSALRVAARGSHTCALTTTGNIRCWGRNSDGQIGNGTKVNALTPIEVASDAAAVHAGWVHTCARTQAGGVRCWGNNQYGQLGDGTTTGRLTPVDATGVTGTVSALGLGATHGCALVGGGLKCWGRNQMGQLGDVTDQDRSVAVAVSGLSSDVVAVTAGTEHSCALTSTGGVKCWGTNSSSQLGSGNKTHQWVPGDVVGLTSGVAKLVSGSYHNCVLTQAGAVKCWGLNMYGQLGDGTQTERSVAVEVPGLAGTVVALAAGHMHTCALTTSGGARCWGYNWDGQVGDGTTVLTRQSPVDVSGLASGVVDIAAGAAHTCAVLATGGIKCWGYNSSGELGDGTTFKRPTPVDVVGTSSAYTLTVARSGAGGGTVTSDLAGIACGADCSESYAAGTVVTLTAAPAAGSLFAGWSGGGCSGTGGCVVTLATTTSVTATFNLVPDATPDPFGFSAQTNVAPGTAVTSNTITPAGYNTPSGVMVSNGEYSIGCGGTFTSSPGTISPGQSVCVRHLASATPGATVTTTLTIGGVAGSFSSTTAAPSGALMITPDPLAFEGQSMYTTSVPRQVTLSNSGGAPVSLDALAVSGPFALASHTCGTLPAMLAAGGTCTAQLVFSPPDEGPYAGSFTASSSAGDVTAVLTGTGERSLVVHYFGSVLGREPDAAGKAYWEAEAARVQALGADLNEVWYALAMGFFNSTEYLGFNRSDGEFVDDLYRTFLNREPDAAGRDWWLGQVASGLTREVVLVAFMFSDEFRQFTASIFGDTSVRMEMNAVMDFYRGLLFRLPDGGGFNYWVQRFRAAQCAGPSAVTAEAEAISGEFARGPEYAARNRSDAEYVGDLYNAILRRGGDPPGVQFWINLIASGAQSREQVRQQFVQSPEFQGRVAQIIAAGCLP